MDFKIRDEQPDDIEQVSAILKATFPTNAESKLVDVLRTNRKAMISLVAVREDQVLGHILFSPVSTTPPREAKGIGLAPVAVHPDVQSHSIGSQLIREGLRLCKELGYDYCVVLGSPEYYQRFGFEKASSFGIENEYGVDPEFMLIRFSNVDLADGLVKYAPEFALFSV
jgi:putative acetyltransferase